MLGVGVGLMLVVAGVMVSASPVMEVGEPLISPNVVRDLVASLKDLAVADRGVQQELLDTMRNIANTQEGLKRFLMGGAHVELSSDATATEAETSEVNDNLRYFTRSVVAALHTGNNTQLAAILDELKSINSNFKRYFRSTACPEPFMTFGDECFNFQLEDLTWEDSRQRCLKMGGDLAIPKNLTQVRLFINENYPRKNRRNFWLGGLENNKVWEWLNGEAVNPDLWYTNEPSGNGDCLAMFDGWEHPLSDFPCMNERRAICERVMAY